MLNLYIRPSQFYSLDDEAAYRWADPQIALKMGTSALFFIIFIFSSYPSETSPYIRIQILPTGK